MILKYRVKPSFMHTKKASKNNIALQKKSSFQLSKWLALTVMLVKCQVNLVSFLKKGTHIFVQKLGNVIKAIQNNEVNALHHHLPQFQNIQKVHKVLFWQFRCTTIVSILMMLPGNSLLTVCFYTLGFHLKELLLFSQVVVAEVAT